ncbi:MAG: alpha/beta hydrolase [Balneolaceae bacterium]|nr:alpha/beta hydrolase [Balneolaceae bacterium]
MIIKILLDECLPKKLKYRIEVPTLLLYGDADQRSPLNIARELHASIPASKFVIMQGIAMK